MEGTMIQTARILATMWLAHWRELREDEGASSVEYTILVLLGIAVAGLVTIAVTAAVNTHDKDITDAK
jgi:Flp pilus assembly pilin Flp